MRPPPIATFGIWSRHVDDRALLDWSKFMPPDSVRHHSTHCLDPRRFLPSTLLEVTIRRTTGLPLRADFPLLRNAFVLTG